MVLLRSLPLLLCLALTGCADAGPESASPDSGRPMFDTPAADVEAPPPPVAVPEDAPTVLFLGDSIGAGLHLAEHQAFPAVLQRRLVERGLPFELVNASESGRTTAGGVAALPWSLRTEPDLVVIELGGNDGLRGVDPAVTEANLRELVATARDAGARVLLLGVRLPPNYGANADAFDAIYPRVAAELDVPYVPFFMEGVGGEPGMNLPDGLHPTAAGHERLADNVEDALAAALGAL
jgi:acyl-CoA thioesterase-1